MNTNKASALLRFTSQVKRLFGWNTITIHSRYLKYDRKSSKPSGAQRRNEWFNRPRRKIKGVWVLECHVIGNDRVKRGNPRNPTALA